MRAGRNGPCFTWNIVAREQISEPDVSSRWRAARGVAPRPRDARKRHSSGVSLKDSKQPRGSPCRSVRDGPQTRPARLQDQGLIESIGFWDAARGVFDRSGVDADGVGYKLSVKRQ